MTSDSEVALRKLLVAAEGYFRQPFSAIIEIRLDDQLGCLWVNGHCTPPEVTEVPARSRLVDCYWAATFNALLGLFSFEERRLEGLYIAGRLHISGDMAVMARLDPDISVQP